MKKIIFLLLTVLAFANVNAQILDPVKWTTKIEKKSDNTYVLTFDGVIEKEWHLYSQFTPDGGPLPLEVVFKNSNGNYSLVGKAKESKTRTAYNDIFEVNETFFERKAQIQQEIKITNAQLKTVEAELNYQVCKEVCINLEKKFTFVIPINAGAALTETLKTETGAQPASLDTLKQDTLTPSLGSSNVMEASPEKTDEEAPKSDSKRGLWSIFFIAFLSGFAALLTPCVFPMIPMTVSFFTKQSKTKAKGIRNAIIYGIAIIVIYVMLGFIVTWIFGADALNALSTNVWFALRSEKSTMRKATSLPKTGAVGSCSRSRASSIRPCQTWFWKGSNFSKPKRRCKPGAMPQAICAASIGMVPLPQQGSYRGTVASQPLAAIMAAARVSFKGASPLSVRQPRLNSGSPEVSM